MCKFKQKLFNWFEKQDAKSTPKSDSLAQPGGLGSNADTDSDNGSRKKRLIKQLVIWFLSLGILALIIAPIIVSCTRKTQISLSDNISLTYDDSNKVVKIIDNDSTNKKEYTIEANQASSYVAAYFRAINTQYSLSLKVKGSTLPITLNVKVTSSIFSNTDTNTNNTSYIKISTISFGKNGNTLVYNSSSTDSSISSIFAKNIIGLTDVATTYPTSFNWLGLIINLLPTAMIIALLVFYLSYAKKMSGGQESIFGVGKANVRPVKTNVKFTDVAGIDEVRDELKELVDYIQNPSKYSAMGARAPKGVILYGPPGTGKTLIARAVAGEANCNFFPTSGSAFEDMLVGVGAKRVRDLFTRARKSHPSIIFIDEIDSVASKRGKNDVVGGSSFADQTINQLLAEMDGFASDAGVIVIAATNRLDVLDDAILRPGRFDRQIQVSLPDIKGREAILKIHSKNKNISSDVSLLDVARRTPGFSGAQLENVLNEAAILAVRERKIAIKSHDIDEAIDRVIGGPARHGRVITDNEKKQIAYHEAGHALVGLHSKNTEVVQKITIIPRGDAAGYTLQTPAEQEKVIQTKEDLLNQVRMTLGGRAAEEVIYGENNITSGAANDLYKVSKIVKAMVMSLGMSKKMGLTQYYPSEGSVSPLQQKMYSETTAYDLDIEIEKIIQSEYQKAKDIIKKNRKELDLIVETLLILETILKDQIDYIHKNMKLPPEALAMKKDIKSTSNKDKQTSKKVSKKDVQNKTNEDKEETSNDTTNISDDTKLKN